MVRKTKSVNMKVDNKPLHSYILPYNIIQTYTQYMDIRGSINAFLFYFTCIFHVTDRPTDRPTSQQEDKREIPLSKKKTIL